MDINLTLVLQMINFFVAWYVLQRLYFVPVIGVLRAREQQIKQLKHALSASQDEVAHTSQERMSLWHMLKRFVQAHGPAQIEKEPVLIETKKKVQPPKEPSQEAIGHVQKELRQEIVKGASHVQ